MRNCFRLIPRFGGPALLAVALGAFLLTGCQGPAGPAGPPGPTGPAGPPGPAALPVSGTSAKPAPVVVSAGKAQEAAPGATVILKATATSTDNSTVKSYKWTQISGTKATLAGADSDTLKVTLAGSADYRAALMEALKPQDRYGVQAVNPHALASAQVATFKVTATTSSGSYSGTVSVSATLSYTLSTGLENIPVGVPVLMHGKKQASYSWSIAVPSGSKTTLDDASGQNPMFTPDVAGEYTLSEKTGAAKVTVYAGTWAGAVTGVDDKGQPLAVGCTVCHNGKVAADQFTAWRQSGHAQIFTQNINAGSHYTESCLECHTVGLDVAAKNGGIDDTADYAAFVKSGMLEKIAPNNMSDMLAKYPASAKLTNIQCESCHGPNDGSKLHANGKIDNARVSISSDLCGECHGEPPRHGRYQQWEESKHGDFTLAIEDATVENRAETAGHCGRCHAGQGFLAWIKQGDLTKNIQGAKGNATVDELKAMGLTKDTVQPQTCVVCHDPHEQGTTSGEPNTATVRIEDNTPMLPSGFSATGVGRGAICITCHNTRNGLHNDTVPGQLTDSAPHVAAQGDILMGQNVYLVAAGQRSSHSYVQDTCAGCHMEFTPPPADLSSNGGGTNHSFEASRDICKNCHGALTADGVQSATETKLVELKSAIERAIIAEIKSYTDKGNTFVLVKFNADKTDVNITKADTINNVEFAESHGRMAMNITVNGKKYEAVRLSSDTAVKESSGTTLLSSARGQSIAKAGWNYFMIEDDSSEGVHNPSLTSAVLNASIAALK